MMSPPIREEWTHAARVLSLLREKPSTSTELATGAGISKSTALASVRRLRVILASEGRTIREETLPGKGGPRLFTLEDSP